MGTVVGAPQLQAFRALISYRRLDESPAVAGPTRDALRTITNKNASSRFVCRHTILELTALCPKTRIPDFYRLVIEYVPGAELVELKSLKLYLDTYRERELYHEELLNEVFQDFERVVKPRWVRFSLEVNVRGGIQTLVTREAGKMEGVPRRLSTKDSQDNAE